MPFVWNDELSVGHDEIDLQHRTLIELLNRLESACSRKADREAIAHVVTGLLFYTQTHFAFEEELMRDNRYPEYEAHVTLHQRMIDDIRMFKSRFEDGDDIADDLLSYVTRWLRKHIMMEDQKYVPFIKVGEA